MNYQKSHPESIKNLFASIAERYDLTNGVNSLGLHLLWNRSLQKALFHPPMGGGCLDLCCGTGAISLPFLRRTSARQTFHLIDFCQPMLDKARQRAASYGLMERHDLQFTQADAQELPLGDGSIERIAMAYGIRNIADPERALRESYRIARPGAELGILELTRPSSALLRRGHSFYLRHLLPRLGKVCTSNREAYQYLCETIQQFIEPKELEAMIRGEGFSEVTVRPLSGGIVHLFHAKKR